MTFTRDELDAAEPERHPSARRRWLIGFAIGVVGGVAVGYGSAVSLLVLLALPFAFTVAGSGVLVGAGTTWAVALVMTADRVLGGGLDDRALVFWSLGGAVLAIGLLGTVVVARRERTRAG